MLIYEYRIRDEFDKVKQYAENIRAKFVSNISPDDLLLDQENLSTLFENLEEMLPKEIRGRTGFRRHLAWMKKRLNENKPDLCQSDIDDICISDLPSLEKLFRDWCAKSIHFDQELVDKITDLLIHLEYDSAIRKAFVILKSRLASRFNAPNNLDGTDLVNHIFGKSGSLSQHIKDNERQAMRDLLSGLYGVFRNRYGHEDIEPSWHETDAILSMINYVLKDIERFEGNVPVT